MKHKNEQLYVFFAIALLHAVCYHSNNNPSKLGDRFLSFELVMELTIVKTGFVLSHFCRKTFFHMHFQVSQNPYVTHATLSFWNRTHALLSSLRRI